MILRPATRSDLIDFYGQLPPMTVRAIVAVNDDKPVGVGGYYLNGGVAVAFTNQRNMPKRDIVRGARALIDMLKPLGMDVFAGAEGDGSVLRHFGFEPYGEAWKLR